MVVGEAVSRGVALVTGASRGIGRACARRLALAGFDVAVGARTVREGTSADGLPGSLEGVVEEIQAMGRRALACPVDLADHASRVRLVEEVLTAFGRVDVLVNSALLVDAGHMRTFDATPIEECETAFAVNTIAPLHLVQLVVPSMRAAGGGVIVGISSGAGQNETKSLPGAGGWPLTYSVTKAAINRATTGLAKELCADDIAVVNIEPGVVATERMLMVTERLGIDGRNYGVSTDVPGVVCAHIAAHPTPMAFSGRTVDAPQFAVWAGLVDGTTLPYPYGPDGWGRPPVVAVAGVATGMESALPGPLADELRAVRSGSR